MSKGTKLTPIRIAPAILASIDAAAERQGKTRSEWIISACLEKLRHGERSNGRTIGPISVADLKTVEEHRRRDFATGTAWLCPCDVCESARSAE